MKNFLVKQVCLEDQVVVWRCSVTTVKEEELGIQVFKIKYAE